jgi:hypothetical protein
VGTVPTRALHPTEEFVVTLEANTQAASLREWFTPIFYDTAALSYVRSSSGPLWNALIETNDVRYLRWRVRVKVCVFL